MKNMENKMKVEEAKRKYKKFLKDNDFKDVREYFTIGLEAEIFHDRNTGKLLTKNDDIFWGFYTDKFGNILWERQDVHKAVYLYTFRRQPVGNTPAPQLTPEQIMLKRLQEGGRL